MILVVLEMERVYPTFSGFKSHLLEKIYIVFRVGKVKIGDWICEWSGNEPHESLTIFGLKDCISPDP